MIQRSHRFHAFGQFSVFAVKNKMERGECVRIKPAVDVCCSCTQPFRPVMWKGRDPARVYEELIVLEHFRHI